MGQPINPPDGWSVTSGTWGVDFQRDTTTYLTTNTSLKVVGTSGNTQTLVGPWFPIDANGVAYALTSVVQATNNTSLFTLKLELYDADQVTLSTTIYLYNNQAVPTASAWQTASKEFVSTSTYQWGRVVLTRATAQTASIYIDRVELKKLGPRWGRHKNPGTGQTIVSATPLTVSFGTSDYASLVTSAATSVTVYRSGLYLLQFKAYISSLAAADVIEVVYKVTDPNLGAIEWNSVLYKPVDVGGGTYVIYVNHVALYRHAGTSGGGSPISVLVKYTGASSPSVNATPAAPFNNELTALTSFTGVWVGMG